MDSGGERVSLAVGSVVSITKNGEDLTPDDQETLWLSNNNPAGSFTFKVETISGILYTAVLDWVPIV